MVQTDTRGYYKELQKTQSRGVDTSQTKSELKIPEQYQEAFRKFEYVYNLPQPIKIIITDRSTGKTKSKALLWLEEVVRDPRKRFAWIRRGFQEILRSCLEFWKETINQFVLEYYQGNLKESDFDIVLEEKDKKRVASRFRTSSDNNPWSVIHRGVFYKGVCVIFFFELFHPEDARGAITGNPQEIVFDEAIPPLTTKKKKGESVTYLENEEWRWKEMLKSLYRTKAETPPRIVFLANPSDRFAWFFKNWFNDKEELDKARYLTLESSEHEFFETKNREAVFLWRVEDTRDLLDNYEGADDNDWEIFFAPIEELGMIELPNRWKPEYKWQNLVLGKIKNQELYFFKKMTREEQEKFKNYVPEVIFDNYEYRTTKTKLKLIWEEYKYKKKWAGEWLRMYNEKELKFVDSEARDQILTFIDEH